MKKIKITKPKKKELSQGQKDRMKKMRLAKKRLSFQTVPFNHFYN